MKKISKRCFSLLMSATLVLGTIPAVYAASQDGLSAVIVTDKESYTKGEEAKVGLEFANTGSNVITNIVGELEIPDGIVLSDGCDNTVRISSLGSGEETKIDMDVALADGDASQNSADEPETGDKAAYPVFILMAIAAGTGAVICRKKKVKNIGNACMVVLVISALGLMMPVEASARTESRTFTVEKIIQIDGEDAVITAKISYDIEVADNEATDNNENQGDLNNSGNEGNSTNSGSGNSGSTGAGDAGSASGEDEVVIGHVTVHDPSIVKDPATGTYYIFGSHMAWAKSDDLGSWTIFTNNINSDYRTIFADAAEWSAKGSSSYDLSGNLWAPDVIYNKELGKWCMYMSVNGDNWYSSIVMLTADSLDGDWTLAGTVAYSGFVNADEAAETDFYDVYKGTDFPSRYTESRNGSHTYGMNCIDPCVFYDEDGKLWMTYGSWFGGLYMLELDPATGLRDYSHTYETIENVSDEYQGIKIAGGNHVSGEASYIEHIGDYYYLYVTLGGLTSDGGYNMRVFRSEAPTGPYTDISGDSAVYTSATNNINGKVGVRLMSYYKWDYMSYGYVAQGHNSAFVDDDGRAYVIYHTRFDNQGEGHQVRVHQLFVNEDGWQVAAPFEYTGEKLAEVDEEQVTGTYSVLFHESTDYASKKCNECTHVTLNEDGTISGSKEGTWTFSEAKGAPYVTLNMGGKEYKGVFVEQKMEDSEQITMTFTVVGCDDETPVWGYRLAGGEEKLATEAADAISVPMGAMADITLPSEGLNATTIKWTSSNPDVISNDGKVTLPESDTVVTMTAEVTFGSTTVTKDFDIKVFAAGDSTEDKVIWKYFADEEVDLSSATNGTLQFANPFNRDNIAGLSIVNGVSVKFHVKATGGDLRHWTNDILSFNTGAVGGLYVMDKAYLGYNATGGYFDANLHNGSYPEGVMWTEGTNFIGDEADVEIKFLPTGFEYYVNGEKVYDNSDVPSDEVPGSNTVTNYISVLTYLNRTATYLNFGWGSWWESGFMGTISDVTLSVMGAPSAEPVDDLYYDNFESADTSIAKWTALAANDGSLTTPYDSTHGYYLKYYGASARGNRCAFTTFDEKLQLTGNYVVEADIMLNAGGDRDSEFVILGTDATYGTDKTNKTAGVDSGYILKIDTSDKSETCTVAGTDDTVTIPKNTWTHIKVVVNSEGKVIATVGDTTVKTTVDGSGTLGGIYALIGRNTGLFAIDNIRVNNATVEDLAGFSGKSDAYTDLVNYNFKNGNLPDDISVINGEATIDGIKLVNGHINLPSTLFENLADDAKTLRVEITMSKQNSDWPDLQWSERLFNFTDDNDGTDGVQTGTNGFCLSYNGNIGTTKVPYGVGVNYMDSALTGANSLGFDTRAVVVVEFEFETNTASLYLNGNLVQSGVSTDTLTVADFQKFTYNSIGRSYDMWSMWGFMTVESFSVSYQK